MQAEFVWLKGVMWEKPINRSPDSSEAEIGESSQGGLGEPTAWDLRFTCLCVWSMGFVGAPGPRMQQ